MAEPPVTAPGATRAEDALALVRLARGPATTGALVGWLARRTGGTAALVTGAGAVLSAAPGPPSPGTVRAVAELHRRGTPSAVTGAEAGHALHLVALAPDCDRYLALEAPAQDRWGGLLTDTARVLELCLRAEEYGRHRTRTEEFRAHGREAVLHLLVGGHIALAHRVAGAMGDRLPTPVRVCVVETSVRRRAEVAALLEHAAQGSAWIVPCPVRSRHLIALVPVSATQWEHAALRELPECRIGASEEVGLRETALGYEQAFHALAVARGLPGRWSRFGRHDGLGPLLGPQGALWAEDLLRPCLDHVPARRSDPGAEELLGTLSSWLTFGAAASRHLRVHRNTLTARLRVLEELLGLDVPAGLADQSAAWLALRLRAPRTLPPTGDTPDLDTLLARPAARTWARSQLSPLGEAGTEALRAWLLADTRLPEAAATLGLSPPGLRKRLLRVEEATGRSLLRAPSSKYELWLALRARDLS